MSQNTMQIYTVRTEYDCVEFKDLSPELYEKVKRYWGELQVRDDHWTKFYMNDFIRAMAAEGITVSPDEISWALSLDDPRGQVVFDVTALDKALFFEKICACLCKNDSESLQEFFDNGGELEVQIVPEQLNTGYMVQRIAFIVETMPEDETGKHIPLWERAITNAEAVCRSFIMTRLKVLHTGLYNEYHYLSGEENLSEYFSEQRMVFDMKTGDAFTLNPPVLQDFYNGVKV